MRHADIVQNRWHAAEQQRVGWVTKSFAWLPNGSYLFTTEFHEDDECPFTDGDVVKMRSVEGGLENGGD